MNLITDRQTTWNSDAFPKEYDTVKVFEEGRKHYKHGDETFATKSALRRALCSEYGGAWIEKKEGKKRYFIDESGWFKRSIREVSKEEFAQKLETPSTWQKVLGIGLGILALAPGAIEFARHIPKEAGLGLLALQQKNPLLGVVGYSCFPSSADAQAMGTEFQVNTYTTNTQLNPSVAPLNDGGFVVSWQSAFQDGDGYGIFGQRYNATGARAGTEFQVNTYTTNNQRDPSVAPLNDGGFVVSWQSDGQDGDLDGIYGQRYNVTGARAGTEFQVNTYTTSRQQFSSVAPLNDGGFVVSWASNGQDVDSWGIYGQRYNAAGVRAGTEFQVNTYTTNTQYAPSVAPLNDGGFVVSWQSAFQDGDHYGVFEQRYNASGARAGTEFQVNTYTTSYQEYPSVAPLNDGGFVITWESDGQDGASLGIYGQRYNAAGAPNGSEFQVNTYTTSEQREPTVAPLNDGGFVVTWQSSGQDGDLYGIYGQRYDATGAPNGLEFQVNNYTISNQLYPSVAPLNDGGFVVTWMSSGQDGDLEGIYGQRYDSNGTAIPLSDLPSMSSASALSSNAGTTNAPSSQLSLTASSSGSSSLSLPPSSTSGEQSSGLSTVTSQLNSMGSSALSSNEPTTNGLSLQSSPINSQGPLTSVPSTTLAPIGTSVTTNSPPSNSLGIILYSVIDIVYEESYPIYVNGQTVGTYTISGGSGLLDSGNSNVITMHFNPSYYPEEGELIPLFAIPQGQGSAWQNIQLQEDTFECLFAREEIVSGSTNSNYQLVFERASSCATMAPQILISAIAMATN